MIILGYVATSAFEATALPTVITYLFPDFNQVYLYSIAGKDIYLTTIILGVGVAILITIINIKGAKTAAILQTVLTAIIAIAGILLVVGSAVNGDASNITGQMWESGAGNTLGSVFKVACMTPFLLLVLMLSLRQLRKSVFLIKDRKDHAVVYFPCSSLVSADHLCSLLHHAAECHCTGNEFPERTGLCKSH